MANIFEDTDRRVIPNWRSFGKSVVLGELNSFQKEKTHTIDDYSIDEYIIDWKVNNTIIHASDLLSAAIINDKKENTEVKNAAKFILNNKNKSTFSQVSLAERILSKKSDIDLSTLINQVTLDNLPTFIKINSIQLKIKETKRSLSLYPYNPILYVELSRYYSILGQEKSSINAMKIAIHLGANNRFILRSATRLFVHYNNTDNEYLDYIHSILKKSPLTILDPWLLSAEISIATMRSRSSRFIKKGLSLINSNNISPFNFTELASSLGTIELLNGSNKKSKILFNKALISPNDNSLAQVEWASKKDLNINIDLNKFNVQMNYEAITLDSYHNSNYDNALQNAAKWFIDMPFSIKPILFGSNLASTILKDHKKSISFLNAGLVSHPNDPQLINNLAYAFSMDNRPDEALLELNKVKNHKIGDSTKACLTATKGLAYFRSGLPEQGRRLYLDAIEQTNSSKNKNLNWIAILNYAREEIILKSEFVEPIMNAVNKIPDNYKNIEINVLKNDIIKEYKKLKE
ncbi:tetratricopeptide repeat protein [Polaribacter sp. SA4-12]|uniref:tetratricopeptide repeat protein n=1 Tax=Polaribacter sp. SA4-12 TaxID=1312072 RepID=UPI000B3D27CC|nr:hypothetical protein [Polaribacter sp. SA4-12]ARV15168.1 hypothetical protein BTO07_08415 [Polaribacter sp. SA4-12]